MNEIPKSSRSSYRSSVAQSRKIGSSAMWALYATRRFLDSEIVVPAGGFIPKLVSVDDRHRESLRKIDKLRNIAKRSHEVLASANTVFPITLFRDSVIVDRSKVTIIQRTFFWTSKTVGIQIEDILNVSCGVGPFFGSLIISVRVMNSTDHFEIDYFWRHDAIHMKHIIQGYMIAKRNKVDLDSLTRRELMQHLSELGHDSDVAQK
jgi:hypothetical protein